MVSAAVPDALDVLIGREIIRPTMECTPVRLWVITLTMPRRNKAFQVMKGKFERVTSSGETFDDALADALRSAQFQRGGTIPG